MTIQIELTPEEDALLRERAARRGLVPEALAHELLASQLRWGRDEPDPSILPVVDEHGVFHPDRWKAVLDYFDRTSAGLPVLPTAALTREAMYGWTRPSHGSPSIRAVVRNG